MVLQGFLAKLGLSGIQGLSQGGGFGLGYGFMVRAGYDLYGQMRESVMKALTGARYTPDTGTSMMGTGGLMGLQRTNDKPQVDSKTLNELTARVGKSNVNEYLRRFGTPVKTAYAQKQNSIQVQSSNPINIRTGRRMSDWYYNNVYLVNKRNDRIRARGRHGHRQVFNGLSRIA